MGNLYFPGLEQWTGPEIKDVTFFCLLFALTTQSVDYNTFFRKFAQLFVQLARTPFGASACIQC